MKKILNWFKESNRYKHLIGGIVIGMCALSWYNAIYASAGVGLAMEYKDKAHGGDFDIIDAGLTLAGGIIGQSIFQMILYIVSR